MSDLNSQLQEIANRFVSSILLAMGTASLSDLAAQTSGAGTVPGPARRGRRPAATAGVRPVQVSGRRKRASAEEVQKLKDTALATAKSLEGGFSKGDVMKKSGSKVDLGRALSLLVDDQKLTKKGDRRKTRYWVK